MRIAIPVSDGQLNQHFGHSKVFEVIEADDQIAFPVVDALSQRPGRDAVPTAEKADVPRPHEPAEDRREAVNRECGLAPAGVENAADGLLKGCEDVVDARTLVIDGEANVSGDRDLITDFGHGIRCIDRSIAVDHETRVAAQYQGCIEIGREAACHIGGTRIPGDVIGQLDRVQPEGA